MGWGMGMGMGMGHRPFRGLCRMIRRGFGGRGGGMGSRCPWWRAPEEKPLPRAEFVSDVNLPDRCAVPPNTVLVKTWKMTNTGTEMWPEGVKLVFVKGNHELLLNAQEEFPVKRAAAGETCDISVVLTTPANPGRVTAYFRLMTAEGEKFGHRVWADFIVTTEEEKKAPVEEKKKEEKKDVTATSTTVSAPVSNSSSIITPSAPSIAALTSAVTEKPSTATATTTSTASASVSIQSTSSASTTTASVYPVLPTTTTAVTTTTPSPTQTQYASELEALHNMGFKNDELNLFLLTQHKGNVQEAVAWLFDQGKP
jgi:hypothetical protein